MRAGKLTQVSARAAVLGAVASGRRESVLAAMNAMNAVGERIAARRGAVKKYHDAKFAVFHQMHRHFLGYRRAMARG